MNKQRREIWIGYATALVGTGAAIALHLFLQPWIGSRLAAFGTLYLTVALTVWYWGTRPAILAAALGCIVAEYDLVAPSRLLSESGFKGILIVAIYAMSSALIILLHESRRKATVEVESLATAMEAKQRRLGAEIADKELAEAEARAQAERFRVLADSAPVLIWMSGPDRALNWYNKPWLAFVGRMLEQEREVDWGESIHPEDFDRCIRAYQEAVGTRTPFSLEYRLRRFRRARPPCRLAHAISWMISA